MLICSVLQSRLAQQGLSTLDVGGAGDCFFRAVSLQLYGEPRYHMNIRCVGVQYMRTNPERFIESIAGDSWARYLADIYIYLHTSTYSIYVYIYLFWGSASYED